MNFKERFIKKLSDFLAAHGFIYDGVDPYFVKHVNDVTYIVALNVSSSGIRQSIIPNLFLVSNQISNKRKTFLELKHKGKHYFTVITNQYEVADLFNKPEYRILNHIIIDETSFNVAITNFQEFMNSIGFSFFERFKTLADFDAWFSEPVLNGTYNFKRGNILNFAVEGLVAAKLNKNPNYEKLYEIWMESISLDDTQALEIVKTLKEYLDNLK